MLRDITIAIDRESVRVYVSVSSNNLNVKIGVKDNDSTAKKKQPTYTLHTQGNQIEQ